MFFEQKSGIHLALRNITQRLRELNIPYAIAGGMAMFYHGFRRFTEDVDILVTREGLDRLHRELDGRGYVPVFPGSKNSATPTLVFGSSFLSAATTPAMESRSPLHFPTPSRRASSTMASGG